MGIQYATSMLVSLYCSPACLVITLVGLSTKLWCRCSLALSSVHKIDIWIYTSLGKIRY